MKGHQYVRDILIACVSLSVLLLAPEVRAELKPGEVLDQSTWQEAKGMMPEAILRRFASGQHLSKIIELPPEAIQWGRRFTELTEANLGKYEVNERGVFIEKSTGTWPHYYPGGFPFAQIDPDDPKAAYKIIYNFYSRGGPIDDLDLFLNMFWVDDGGLNRSIDFVGQVIGYASRWSGPSPTPRKSRPKRSSTEQRRMMSWGWRHSDGRILTRINGRRSGRTFPPSAGSDGWPPPTPPTASLARTGVLMTEVSSPGKSSISTGS